MRHIYLAVFVLFGAVSVNAQINSSALDLSESEYQFISTLYPKAHDLNLVIEDRTFPTQVIADPSGFLEDSISLKKIRKVFPQLSDETISDYNAKNTASVRLDDRLTFPGSLHLVSRTQLLDIVYKPKYRQDGWKAFRRQFSGATFIQQFSRVGFNNTGDQALVYSIYSSQDCSEGAYGLYLKRNGVWTRKGYFVTWRNDEN